MKPGDCAIRAAVLVLVSFGPLAFPSHSQSSPATKEKSGAAPQAPTTLKDTAASDLNDVYAQLPLRFEANQGQAASQVRFLSRTGAYTLFLTSREAVLALQRESQKSAIRNRKLSTQHLASQNVSLLFSRPESSLPSAAPGNPSPEAQPAEVLHMRLVGSDARGQAVGLDEFPGKSNYFIGNDPTKWRTNVPNYAKVKYQDVYPGVDLVYYGNQGGQLEYDFVVAPDADPRKIRLEVGAGPGSSTRSPSTAPLCLDASGDFGRIDSPNAGWKGRGIWATYGGDMTWHIEGGAGTKNKVLKFQLRPSPLAD